MSWETSKYFFYLGRELLSFFPNFAFLFSSLEGLAHEIQGQYSKFDEWRINADNVNQDLVELDTQIKTEEKIGKDIPFVKLQLADNQVRPTPLKMFIFWDLSSNPGSVFFSDPETVGGRGDV